jgi:peroxiredoxin
MLTGRAVPEPLASALLVYEHGARKRFGSFWSTQPTFFLFLRHNACPGCAAQISSLAPHLPELRRLGSRVVLIGLCEPNRLLPFRERMQLEDDGIELVTDPTASCHREAGLVRGAWSTFGPKPVLEALRLHGRAAVHGTPGAWVRYEEGDGDILQQGGAMFVDRAGVVQLHHAAQNLADYVDLEAVRRLACELSPRARA